MIDGDDYTWTNVRLPDVRTADQKVLEEVADLRNEVFTLTSAFAALVKMMDVRPNGMLPGGRPAVMITRRDDVIESRHVVVYNQVLHDAPSALRKLEAGNWVFVHPNVASAVLDVLGVQP